jgi:hypothetical protein
LEEVFLRVADEADEFHGEGARPDKESPVEDVAVAITAKRRRSSVVKKPAEERRLLTKDIDVEPAGGSHLDHFVAIFNRRLLQFSPSRAPCNFLFNILLPAALIIGGGVAGSYSATAAFTSYPVLQMSASKAFGGDGPAVTTIYNAGSGVFGKDSLSVKQQSSTTELVATLNARNSNPSSDSNMDSAFSFDSTSSKYGLYINRQYPHALPVSLNYLASNFQRTGTQPAVAFTLYSAPLRFTLKEVPEGTATYLILLIIAYSFIPGYVVSKAVTERVTKARHLLRVMGMRSWVYWASNFVFDFLYFSLFTLIAIVCAYAFNIQGFSSNSKTVLIIALVFTSVVNVLFCYLLSFFFSNGTSAQMAVFGLMIFFGLIGGVLYNSFNAAAAQTKGSLKDTWTTVTTAVFAVCGLIPSFHIIAAPLSSQISPSSFEQTLSNKWENQSLSDTVLRTFAGNSFIFLGVHLVVSSMILFALESPSLRV